MGRKRARQKNKTKGGWQQQERLNERCAARKHNYAPLPNITTYLAHVPYAIAAKRPAMGTRLVFPAVIEAVSALQKEVKRKKTKWGR